jgi:hypothetical protein
MSIFEIHSESSLKRFRRIPGGADLYENEIEELVWKNPEELTGEVLLPIARQPIIPGGGRPDIVALDSSARVIVIEVKRDVDRRQLAQCLEYAGWARGASSDELARMYHLGEEQFYEDWRAFTDGDAIRPIVADPQLVLVAREFAGRTKDALDFLLENGLPVSLVTVGVYEDPGGRRFLDVNGIDDSEFDVAESARQPHDPMKREFSTSRVSVADLCDKGLLVAGDELVWERPRLGLTYTATVTDVGEIQIEDGRTFSSPSGAARAAAAIPAYNGWLAWSVVRTGEAFTQLWDRYWELEVALDPPAGVG